MGYVAAHLEHVAALALLDGTYPDAATVKTRSEQRAAARSPEQNTALSYWSEPQRIADDPEKTNFERFKAMLPSFFYDRSKGEQYVRDLSPGDFSAAVTRLLQADTPKVYELVPRLRGSPVPTLIMQGQQDLLGDSGPQLHTLLPNSKLVFIPESGHLPWIEQPQEFRANLLAFLGEKRT